MPDDYRSGTGHSARGGGGGFRRTSPRRADDRDGEYRRSRNGNNHGSALARSRLRWQRQKNSPG